MTPADRVPGSIPSVAGMTPRKTWTERINNARVQGGFDEEDRYLSSNFRTCAVGEGLADEDYVGGISILSNELIVKGMWFCDAVHRNDFGRAAVLLQEICDLCERGKERKER